MEFLDTFSPSLKSAVELYKGKEPLFDAFGIETAINSALDKNMVKIWWIYNHRNNRGLDNNRC